MLIIIVAASIAVVCSLTTSVLVCISYKNVLFEIFSRYIENELLREELKRF